MPSEPDSDAMFRNLPMLALSALVLLTTHIDSAAPQTVSVSPWPDRARGRALPQPAWILVVPAHRTPDGRLSIWDRRDAWTAAWRVPAFVDGMRVVTLTGDAEDARNIDAGAIDDMRIDPIDRVMRKYGAPAMGLAVDNGSSAAIAVYMPGHPASWLPVDHGTDAVSTRTAALDAFAAIVGGRTSAGGGSQESPVEDGVPDEGYTAEPERPRIVVAGWRPAGDGYNDFRLVAPGSGEDVVAALTEGGRSRIVEIAGTESGVSIVVEYAGEAEEFERDLSAAGFDVR